MNFAFSEEQEELRKSVRRFLESKSPETAVRELMETTEGYDKAVWNQMGEQLGLQGLAIPEEYGGSGYSYVELIIVLEEMGRALLAAPYFSTVALAANALLTSGDDAAKKELLPGIASGETIATLAITEDSGRWDLDAVTAHRHQVRRRLHPRRPQDVRARRPHRRPDPRGREDRRRAQPLRRRGRRRRPHPHARCRPWTRPASRPASSSPARRPASSAPRAAAAAGLQKTLDLAAVALAAEQVGGAQKCLDMSVEYAKVRVQFGRPIGSFQAIKHKCADMLLEVESAKSAAYYAGWAAAEDSDELPVVASLAKAYCSDAYFHASAENIQIHGGIGFTWEHPAHLYFKRAKSSELLLGDPTYHRELLAQRIGL